MPSLFTASRWLHRSLALALPALAFAATASAQA